MGSGYSSCAIYHNENGNVANGGVENDHDQNQSKSTRNLHDKVES